MYGEPRRRDTRKVGSDANPACRAPTEDDNGSCYEVKKTYDEWLRSIKTLLGAVDILEHIEEGALEPEGNEEKVLE